jgi:hypothetical protein
MIFAAKLVDLSISTINPCWYNEFVFFFVIARASRGLYNQLIKGNPSTGSGNNVKQQFSVIRVPRPKPIYASLPTRN